MSTIQIVIVDKNGTLKQSECKNMDLLYKKCGFKSSAGFELQGEFKIKHKGVSYFVDVFGKTNGKAGTENKYDFPPPLDNTLFFGSCALVAFSKERHQERQPFPLQVAAWEMMYEKLFGGFENLDATALSDEMEKDELEHVPSHMKTKEGYLKDGFVVDDLLEDEDEEGELVEDDYLD